MKRMTLLLCLGLSACSGSGEDPGAPTAADQAKAEALLVNYESARAGGNWEAAEAIAGQIDDRYPDSEAAARLGPGLAEVLERAEAARGARRLREIWDYQAVTLEEGVQRSATVPSRTVAPEEGAPAPLPDAQLVLRDHPSWGRSAYLLLAQSRFDCGSPCRVKIAFDATPAQAFQARQADSGKGPALFIEDEARFIEALEQAGTVRIELPKDSGIVSTLRFDVGGFERGRYEKPAG